MIACVRACSILKHAESILPRARSKMHVESEWVTEDLDEDVDVDTVLRRGETADAPSTHAPANTAEPQPTVRRTPRLLPAPKRKEPARTQVELPASMQTVDEVYCPRVHALKRAAPSMPAWRCRGPQGRHVD